VCLRTEEQNVASISTSCNEEKEETHIGFVPAVIASQNLSPQNVSTYISPESLSTQRPTSNQENERVLSQPRLTSVQAMDLLKSNDNPSLYQHDSHISDLSSPTSSDSPVSVRSVPSIPSSLVDVVDVGSVLDNSHDLSSQRGNLSFSNCSSSYTHSQKKVFHCVPYRIFAFHIKCIDSMRLIWNATLGLCDDVQLCRPVI